MFVPRSIQDKQIPCNHNVEFFNINPDGR